MDIQEVKARIKEIIFETTNVKVETISDTAHFKDDMDFDSLTLMEIAVSIDQEYDLDLPEDQFDLLVNVDACAQLIFTHCKSKESVGG